MLPEAAANLEVGGGASDFDCQLTAAVSAQSSTTFRCAILLLEMGRSARQRSLKSVDPFNPKRGQILAAARNPADKDLAPDVKEDKKIPRALRHMILSQEKMAKLEGPFHAILLVT